MVQDWGGGPIGFWVATRHPEWFRAFVIGNTWAWPMRGEWSTEWFSKALGSSVLGGLLVRRADVFVNVFMRGGIRRRKLTPAERQIYKRPRADRQPMRLRHRAAASSPPPRSPAYCASRSPSRTSPWRRARADALARRPADRRAPPPPGLLRQQRTTRLAAHPRSGVAIEAPRHS
jgi:pimeloyl-ACP methyl ester carboxylesterase